MSDPETDGSLYRDPIVERWASREMAELFSPLRKFRTWRALWIELARAEMELGLPVTAAQVAELEAHRDDVDLAAAARKEREVRHDVMAHIHVYGDRAPGARPIIHLGATSAFVVDNADLLLQREAMDLVRARLVNAAAALAAFARRWKDRPCLSFTHLQPAQPTTVGKRACLWLQDLLLDLEELEARRASLRFLGVKGTTGTQASFLDLFRGDGGKVRALDAKVAAAFGFARTWPVTGQTYSRKVDAGILATLSGIAQSAHKFGNDVRLLMHMKEVDEPSEKGQIGSSAMAYKLNPMRSERMTGLARHVMALASSAAQTAAEQWLERTLDDSSAKRLFAPQAFLATDAILLLHGNVARGLVVHGASIDAHLRREMPFMATEAILMRAVERGGDRQDLHERIRVHSREAGAAVKGRGEGNDLLGRLAADPAFAAVKDEIPSLADASRHVGRSAAQVEEFLAEEVEPVLERHRALLGGDEDLRV
ncbi:MAG: adenylosuccinate lyase [Planctomycetaceae bacterium]|nr:adenylosuccinate lyase [Planctomycetota bacterium]NUN52467.1 adenylosuccinate lyase [Planctomycetaceae bacterium]